MVQSTRLQKRVLPHVIRWISNLRLWICILGPCRPAVICTSLLQAWLFFFRLDICALLGSILRTVECDVADTAVHTFAVRSCKCRIDEKALNFQTSLPCVIMMSILC